MSEEIGLLEHVVQAPTNKADHDRSHRDFGHDIARDSGALRQRHDGDAIRDVKGNGVLWLRNDGLRNVVAAALGALLAVALTAIGMRWA